MLFGTREGITEEIAFEFARIKARSRRISERGNEFAKHSMKLQRLVLGTRSICFAGAQGGVF